MRMVPDEVSETNGGVLDANLLHLMPQITYLVMPPSGEPGTDLTAENIFVVEERGFNGSDLADASKPVPVLDWVRDLYTFSSSARRKSDKRLFELRIVTAGNCLAGLVIRDWKTAHG